jgi:hypothetical protein
MLRDKITVSSCKLQVPCCAEKWDEYTGVYNLWVWFASALELFSLTFA